MEEFNLREYIRFNVLTTAEAAEYAKVSKSMINKLVDDGIIEPVKKSPQGSWFIKADIDAYINDKKQDIPNRILKEEILYCEDPRTSTCVKYFKEHRGNIGDIESIFVYFNSIDAIINGFFQVSTTYGCGDLRHLNNPLLILRDKDGKEMWLSGCNCGYGGTGPHGTAEILEYLVKEGTLPEKEFTHDYIEKLIWHRKISIMRIDDDKWDICATESLFGDTGGGASIYSYKGQLVLIQDPYHYKNESALNVIAAYNAFIPNPIKVKIFPTNELAEKDGYVLLNKTQKQIYNIIISDISGRQIWIYNILDNKRDIINNPSIKNILESCGFSLDLNDISKDKVEPHMLQEILKWCKTTFNTMAEKPVIIEKK